MDKNNQLENKNCKPHIYIIQNRALLRNKKSNEYEEPYVVPYPIAQVWTNGNLAIHRGAMQDRINIRCIKSYHE